MSHLSFFLLFGWASFINWSKSHTTPAVYLEYASLEWSDLYVNFIRGWFAQYIPLVVGSIAVCQGLIALSMFTGGFIFRIGAIGATIFLLAILPLGVGAGFHVRL